MQRHKDTRGFAGRYRVIKLEGVDKHGNRISHFVRRVSVPSLTNEEPESATPKQLLN